MDERLHREYLDRFGGLEAKLSLYRSAFFSYTQLRKEIDRLSMDEIEKARLNESLRYQISELERAELKTGELDELISRRDLLRNSEKLTDALDAAFNALYGGEENALTYAQNAEYYTERAAAIASELQGAAKSLQDAVFSLSDAAELLRDFRDGLDFSPEEYDRLEERIGLLESQHEARPQRSDRIY